MKQILISCHRQRSEAISRFVARDGNRCWMPCQQPLFLEAGLLPAILPWPTGHGWYPCGPRPGRLKKRSRPGGAGGRQPGPGGGRWAAGTRRGGPGGLGGKCPRGGVRTVPSPAGAGGRLNRAGAHVPAGSCIMPTRWPGRPGTAPEGGAMARRAGHWGLERALSRPGAAGRSARPGRPCRARSPAWPAWRARPAPWPCCAGSAAGRCGRCCWGRTRRRRRGWACRRR